jgi:hypothetical protein
VRLKRARGLSLKEEGEILSDCPSSSKTLTLIRLSFALAEAVMRVQVFRQIQRKLFSALLCKQMSCYGSFMYCSTARALERRHGHKKIQTKPNKVCASIINLGKSIG